MARAVADRQAVGQRLIFPFQRLNQNVRVHTRELVVVAGAPSGGKSTLAINIAMHVDFPVLYFAQDSPSSVLTRMTALNQGEETGIMMEKLAEQKARMAIAARMADVRPTLVIQRGAVRAERVGRSVDALTEWIGYAPPLVIIDNLIDLLVDGYNPSETGFYSTALPTLKQLAIERNTCIMVLHHVTRGKKDKDDEHATGQSPMTMNDLLFAGEREARHVWGVYNDGHNTIKVQILKQQDGKADGKGRHEVELRWYPSLGRLA